MLRGLKQFSLPEIEEKVLKFWKENDIFGKSLAKNKGKKKFVFYEGPPTANGRPGIHHVLARAFKDIIPRYKTMQGFLVPRKGGWDTHGLPVELEVEKQLGLRSKKEIEAYGIERFNAECKKSVWKYKDEWERLTERIGFWLDMKSPYVTYENSYIETLWWILNEVWKKKMLYKGHKVVPWCTRCGTALSSHELAQGYKEVSDTSVYIKFKLKKGQKIGGFVTDDNTYILSWTTTPWTLPGNVALAVGEKIEYMIAEKDNEKLIYAQETSDKFQFDKANNLIRGKDLLGLEYEPLFDVKPLKSEKSYKIYPANFVTTTDGTGVVHTAVMYGEDDYNLGKKIGLPQYHTVDEQGKFTKDVKGFEGMLVKSKDGAVEGETTNKIIGYLQKENLLLKVEPYKHEYPFCWRCGTPLLYYARDSWFIAMSKLRAKLLSENKKINWVPEHLQTGRFGEWLKEVKDWAISRERYWGTPLPLWQCLSCEHVKSIGSIKEFGHARGASKNRYILMRHGESESNIKQVNNNWPEKVKMPLTLKGITEVEASVKKLKRIPIDMIYASDITRTKETAEIVRKALGLKQVTLEPRLREINTGDFNGCHGDKYHKYYSSLIEKFTKRPPNGETLTDLKLRVFEFIEELEKKYSGKIILLVSHEYPIWMFQTVVRGWTKEQSVSEKEVRGDDFIHTGSFEEGEVFALPRNAEGELDLHRPFIDTIEFPCDKCKGRMRRVREVVDVWFDSGAMPFAEEHYPFAKKTIDFPADYISEGIDQTRGWFYTLLAISTLLGKGRPFKNVISLGLILDKQGQKMSKSKGNVVDPWGMLQKYGADAIRWYFYTVNPPGEPKRFDEVDLLKTQRQFFTLLYNSFVFFDTYADKNENFVKGIKSVTHPLDAWVLARYTETVRSMEKALDAYDVGLAARTLEEFVGDVSRWYIRRSRRRFQKSEDKKDHKAASRVLGFVLLNVSKLMAPFAPFFADALYSSLGALKKSVHLEVWPEVTAAWVNKELLGSMKLVRSTASLALAKRAEAGIKVRQPLAELKIKGEKQLIHKALLEILQDEVNVKKVTFHKNLEADVTLDMVVTHELKEEGLLREFMRAVQDLRQDAKLTPKDKIELFVDGAKEFMFVVEKFEVVLKKELRAAEIHYRRSDKFTAEIETKIDEWNVWVALHKT